MLYLRQNKGITMVILIIMIIVITILAGISILEGSKLVKTTKVEDCVTNMITIKAKSKVFAEAVNAEVWDVEDKETKREELYLEKYKMRRSINEQELISKVGDNVNNGNGCECYDITEETLSEMGLGNLRKTTSDGDYVVVFDSEDYTNIDVIYQLGIEYEGEIYYTLSSLQAEIELE